MPTQRRPQIRAAVLQRDHWRCHYCANVADTIDHIVPASVGGPLAYYNLVACCSRCNQAKADTVTVWCGCRRCLTARRRNSERLHNHPDSVQVAACGCGSCDLQGVS